MAEKKQAPNTKVNEKHSPIGKEISSGIRNLFDTVTQKVLYEIKEISSRADKDFKRLATSLFFFMLGAVFISIGLVKILDSYLRMDTPIAYVFVGLLLIMISLFIKKNNTKQ